MQNYRPTEEILSLLEDFRCMVNDCVRIGLKENPTSMKSLSMKAYHQLSAYDVPTCYRLTAVSRAAGILRNYRKELKKRNRSATVPYVTRLSLTDCYGFRVIHRLLRLPIRKGEYVFIVLNDHTLRSIGGHTPREWSEHQPLERNRGNRPRRGDWSRPQRRQRHDRGLGRRYPAPRP